MIIAFGASRIGLLRAAHRESVSANDAIGLKCPNGQWTIAESERRCDVIQKGGSARYLKFQNACSCQLVLHIIILAFTLF